MKKIILLFMTVITAVNLNAQEPEKPKPAKKTPEQRAENMSKRMAKELLLSPEQEVKVKEAILKREIARQEKVNAMKKEVDKIDAEFKKILTSEQYLKFKQKQEEMKTKRMQMREKHPENKMPPPAGEDTPPPPPAPEK